MEVVQLMGFSLLRGRSPTGKVRDLSPARTLKVEICFFLGTRTDHPTRNFFFVWQDGYGTVPASMAMMLANCISLAWVGDSQLAFSLGMLQHREYG